MSMFRILVVIGVVIGVLQATSLPILAQSVTFYGAPTAAISSGVVIPPNRAWVWTSGTTPAVADANAKAGTRERFGDTRAQATSILKNIDGQLQKQGLTMKDVVYLRRTSCPIQRRATGSTWTAGPRLTVKSSARRRIRPSPRAPQSASRRSSTLTG